MAKNEEKRKIYRKQESTKWYFIVRVEEANKLNKRHTNTEDGTKTLFFVEREEKKIEIRILWVAPSTKQNSIKRILKTYFKREC